MPESEGWTGGENKNGVALFVPKFAFSGESSNLRRWQFLLTENLRFCALLPQIKAQLMKTAPQFTLSRFFHECAGFQFEGDFLRSAAGGKPEFSVRGFDFD